MSPPDLRKCFSKLDWANNQINFLEAETRVFMNRKPYRIFEERHPNLSGRIMKIKLTESVPESIVTNCGMIIQAIHDSLDYLSVALARYNGFIENRDVCFPIAKSKEFFFRETFQKKIKLLSTRHKEMIKALEPYGGGNEMLSALHTLNTKSKHIDLIAIGTNVESATFFW